MNRTSWRCRESSRRCPPLQQPKIPDPPG
jgi:hypothetical protein